MYNIAMNINLRIKKGENILVGVSGGADSMCLLHILTQAKEKLKFNLFVCHVNHSIRGEEADRDQKLVEDFAKSLGAKCITEKVDAIGFSKKRGLTLEEGARILRYEVFDKLRREYAIDKLYLAHNKGDQAETVLMHIARGSSIAGASGMKEEGEFVCRPLLGVSREEILSYNKKNNVPYIIDSTNLDNSYSRNFIRNEVLPLLKVHYPNIEDSLSKFAKLCAQDEEFISKNVNFGLIFAKNNEVKVLEAAKFLHPSLASRLIKEAVKKLGVFADFNGVHINSVMELFFSPSGCKLDLPWGLVCHRDYDGLTFVRNFERQEGASVKFALKSVRLLNWEVDVEIKNSVDHFEKGKVYLDKSKLPENVLLRTYRSGDKFKKLGASGSKKLCDYFTDKKIEKRKRNSILVLASGSEVLAVLGYDVSELVKVEKTTKEIVVVSQKEVSGDYSLT